MLIGGVAAGQLTEPRATKDVDASLWLDDDEKLPRLIELMARHGLVPQFHDALEFARRSRILPLVHTPSRVGVDVALAVTPYEETAIRNARAVELTAYGLTLMLPRPEDLVVMKAVAHRPQDIADIDRILTFHPNLDVAYVRRRAREFAAAVGDSEIRTELERVLRRHLPKRKPRRQRATRKRR